MKRLAALFLALYGCCLSAAAAEPDAAMIELNQRSFFLGREYYVLRSGRAKLVVQADRADLGPAFTYLLFDAPLARRTLDHLEELWNTRWSDGGYDRYHTSGQPDQPCPWSFATTFILRAQHDAGLYDRSRRSLEWLNTVQGGRAGAWFEAIPSIRPQQRTCGILPWTSGEIALFVVHHYLGVRFEAGAAVIRPALYPGSPPVTADLRFRKGRLRLAIDGGGPIVEVLVDGRKTAVSPDGSVRLPMNYRNGSIVLRTRVVTP